MSLNASVQKQKALLLHSVLTQLQNTGTPPYRWERKRDMFQKAIIAAKTIKTHFIIIDYYQSWGVTDYKEKSH